ncbi:MAG: serine hydrolase [Verrucomicrobiaceae bacterium]|nr:serine hydrolase [Verrucomicrobiaceae bacterium]
MRYLIFCWLVVAGSSLALELNPAVLGKIAPAMEAAVAGKEAAGIVTLVMKEGKVVHHEAVGMADVAGGKPMAKDAVFWIASMTKSINGTALMMLVEEGKVTLDEPAAKWLPALAKVKMKDGSMPKTAITLRMLLSHTAGIAFPPRKADDGAVSLKQYVDRLLVAPLAFEPGSDYEYGFGPTVAGRLLEVVTGKPYEVFLKERLFEPLGMVDTMFHPDEARRARIAQTYKLDEETKELGVSYNPFFTSSVAVKRMVEPAGGLFSAAADMGRFYAMVANGGELDGKRILSEKGVKEMTTPVSAGGKPITYGLGWQCCTEANAKMSPLGVGTFGHGGAFGTNGWVDLERKIVTVFLVQNVLVPAGGKPKEVFQRLVTEAAGR